MVTYHTAAKTKIENENAIIVWALGPSLALVFYLGICKMKDEQDRG